MLDIASEGEKEPTEGGRSTEDRLTSCSICKRGNCDGLLRGRVGRRSNPLVSERADAAHFNPEFSAFLWSQLSSRAAGQV